MKTLFSIQYFITVMGKQNEKGGDKDDVLAEPKTVTKKKKKINCLSKKCHLIAPKLNFSFYILNKNLLK